MPSFEEDINVFDLPNLRSKPTFATLQRTLQALEVKPTTWSEAVKRTSNASGEAAISRYLTGIISNLFEWFDGTEDGDADEKREALWDLASKRVTERCGRSAMGELNRTWVIPKSKTTPELSLTIREPPLTGDNLGFKTWGTAFTMAKRLEHIGTCFLNTVLEPGCKVLELGAGTGLVGVAAAAIWSTDVLLTDLEEIQENLDFNLEQNRDTVTARGGSVSSQVLDWKSDEGLGDHSRSGFDLVIAADSVYDDEHPDLVTKMIRNHLKQNATSRALVAVPLRDKNTVRMAGMLRKNLERNEFVMHHEGWEICRDDWDSENEEGGVKCWWALFGRI